MKKTKKKVSLLLIILLIIFILLILLDSIKFNKETKKVNKYLRVSYVLVDKEKTENADFDDYKSYMLDVIETYNVLEKVTKEGDYYIAKLHYMKDVIYNNTVRNHYAMNNLNGEVISDLKYDKKSKKVYIPKKYFENQKYKKYDGIPVCMEFVSRVAKKDLNNSKISVSINKWTETKKIVNNKNNIDYPIFSIFKYKRGRNITKDDIHIFVNNESVPLENDKFIYDSKAGTITLNMYPIMIKNIKVHINKKSLIKNAILNLLNLKDVFAAKTPAIEGTVSINTTDVSLSYFDGSQGTFQAHYIYKADGGYFSSYKDENLGIEKGWNGGTIAKVEQLFKSMPIATANKEGKILDFLIKFDSTSVSKDYTYACPTESEPKKTCTGTATLTMKNKADRHWLRFWCSGNHVGVDNNPDGKLDFNYDVTVSNNVVTINPKSVQTSGNQHASGKFSIKASLYSLKVRKKLYVSATGEKQNFNQAGIIYRVYSDFASDANGGVDKSNCNGKVLAEEETDANGVATFTNLPESGSYCVKEIFKETKSSSPVSASEYYRDASCNGVVEDANLHNGNIGDRALEASTTNIIAENEYCNVRRKFATAVKKVDADTNENLSGFTFTLNPGNVTTNQTDTAGYTKVCDIATYQPYTFSETGTLSEYWGPTTTASVTAPTYVDSYGDTFPDFANSGLTPYPDGTTCPADTSVATVGTFQNTHKFYCIKIKKIDADTNAVLGGAKFKADGTGVSLTSGSTLAYRNTNAKSVYRENTTTGITTILTADHNEKFKITETVAPEGYAASTDTPEATPTLIGSSASNAKKWSEITFEDCDAYLPDSSASVVTMKNTALNINWYKVSENKTKSIKDAQFKAAFINTDGTTKAIYHKANKETTTDSKGNSRNCYVYSATSTGTGSDIFVADADGQVCVRGVPKGSYRVTETLPGQNHAFGSVITKDLVASNEFEARDDTTAEANKFINIPTYFEFDKSIAEVDGGDKQLSYLNGTSGTLDDILASISTEELKKLDFQIFESDSNGNITNNTALTFEKYMKDNKPYYSYSGNEDTLSTMNITADETTTILHLDDLRKIRVEHLPWGSNGAAKYYVIREVNTTTCGGSDTDCIGYYYPDYSKRGSVFSISTCTNDDSNTTVCTGTLKHATQSLENVPTSIEFTKRDFYHYEDAEDKNNTTQAEFEDANERNEFDRIVFKLKHNGSYMKLVYLGNESSDPNRPNPDCTSDTDYALYKYVPSVENYSLETTEELHTCGGHLRITNLCRGEDYQIEEISVPEDSVFVKENTNSTPTVVNYKIPCTEGEKVKKKSTTNVIDDKGTRVRFEKRDSKYGYLIPDETTTFEVYRCPKDSNGNYTTCNPSNYSTVEEREAAGMKLMKFQSRRVISTTFTEVNENGNISTITRTDEEDPYGAMGEYGVEVYKSMSDSDAEKYNKLCTSAYEDRCYVTDLHPHRGILVLRYLPANYNYVLLETIAPRNYTLPKGINAETPFTVSNQTVSVDEVDVPNKPTSLVIRKYDENMSLITGAKFRIYEKTGNDKSCDYNLSPMNQPKTQLKLKTVYEGIYEARNDADTGVITTCTNRTLSDGTVRNCNELTGTLTAEQYADRWMGFKTENVLKSPDNVDLKGENGIETYTQIQEGEALVQYLEYGHCYIIEEIEAPNGYSLPKKVADRWTMIQIEENDEYDHSTFESLVNLPTPFQFYKYDEFNQLLDGAKFKLQKLNKEKKYEDITVRENEEKEEKTKDKDGNITQKIYEVDDTTDNLTIETLNGTAIIYKLAAGQYRVVETEPAPGKELGKNLNVATFFVNKDGQVFGNRIISNKKKTEKIKRVMSDSAELIVNIQTGQSIVRYGIFIAILVAGIAGLMLYNNRKK